MYQLTPRMEQHFRNYLADYHKLFDGGRCQGWELEELIVKAIKSDTSANHLPRWQEAGHDDKADITIDHKGTSSGIQVKSGQITNNRQMGKILTLSGHRLGRFKHDLKAISDYLNQRNADIISVPYRKQEDNQGRQHIYQICYVPVTLLTGINAKNWQKKGAHFTTTNQHGVEFNLMPSMSWQIWWKIPLSAISLGKEFTNGNFI